VSHPDPLREIEDALSFQVSPDFSARVRQRVAAEPPAPRLYVSHQWLVAAAVVLATAAGVIITFRHLDLQVADAGGTRIINSAKTPVESLRPFTPLIEPVVRLSARAPASRPVSSFETLVPDDQLRALDRLLASMREGRATLPLAESTDDVNDRGERVLRAVVIEPVTIELLPGTPAEPNKNPVKDPNK
jgi:hypothetical protein